MSNKELKPCPFCGEIPVIHFQKSTFSTTGEIYSILCNCEQAKAIGRTKERLIDNWNTRPSTWIKIAKDGSNLPTTSRVWFLV
jgi:Lar family restriction alleviation protein